MASISVLVVGKSGQVARELLRTVPAGQFEVIALGRPDLDICNPQAVRAAVDRHRPGLIINAAAYTAVDQAETDEAAAFALNADAAGVLAAEAARLSVPVIHLSTDYVFDGSKGAPYREDDPVAPLGAYGRSKLAGEQKVAGANPRHVILRTAWVYSAFGRNFAKTMLRLAETREEIGVVHDQRGNPTAADSIAAGVWQVAAKLLEPPDASLAGTYHMAASGEATWAEFAEAIFAVSREARGPAARVKRITSADYPTPVTRPADSRLDSSRLAADFGVELPDWGRSVRRCVNELVATRGWTS